MTANKSMNDEKEKNIVLFLYNPQLEVKTPPPLRPHEPNSYKDRIREGRLLRPINEKYFVRSSNNAIQMQIAF